MRRTLGFITATIGAAALTLSATPAVAATLPDEDSIFILPCDSDEYDGLLYEVDPDTGVATRVGDWVNPDDTVYTCAGPGAYNPENGLGYWIAWESPEAYLISVDLTTGVNTVIDEFTLDGELYYTPIALAIDAEGNAWGTSWGSSPDELFSVDLATAELTLVGPTGLTPESNNYGLAWDPVTETVYGYNVGTQDFYTVDTTTGAFTLFNDDVLQALTPYAIAFDSAGQVWGIEQDIISAPLSDLDDAEVLPVINPYPIETGDIYSESIIIAPGLNEAAPETDEDPELADTGAADSTGFVAIAGVILVAGGLVMSRRRAVRTA